MVPVGSVMVTVLVTFGVGSTRQEQALEIFGAAHDEGMHLGFSAFTVRFLISSLFWAGTTPVGATYVYALFKQDRVEVEDVTVVVVYSV